MHGKGADLNFKRIAMCHDGRVKGLISVGFWHGNIIFESSGDRFPHGVDDAKYSVAVFDCMNEYPYSREIVNFTDVFVVAFHFFINAVKMFCASIDFRMNIRFSQFGANLLD